MVALSGLVALFASITALTSAAATPKGYGDAGLESGQKLKQLERTGNNNLFKYRLKHKSTNGCNLRNTAVRKNFVKMPKWQRKQFTDAVTCLMNKPTTTTNPGKYLGVKSRYDDWPAAHMEFDNLIHFTAQFLHWHRYAIWAFEQDLRSQCGYRGHLPYWDWSADVPDPENAEIFNGDAYSMGSNGGYVKRDTGPVFTVPLPASFLQSLPNPQQNVSLPVNSGTGGGCINENGPFGGKEVAHLGPTLVDFYGSNATQFGPDLFKYNPRCIVRDITPFVMTKYMTYRNVTEAITNSSSIGPFQGIVQSDSRYIQTIGNIGVHAGGHLGAGGDPMADQPSTPGDPIWFLHHAQIDRMWNIWQTQDIDNRVNQVADTLTILNYPSSRDATLQDPVSLEYIGGTKFPPSTIGGLSKSWDGPFCYIYD